MLTKMLCVVNTRLPSKKACVSHSQHIVFRIPCSMIIIADAGADTIEKYYDDDCSRVRISCRFCLNSQTSRSHPYDDNDSMERVSR